MLPQHSSTGMGVQTIECERDWRSNARFLELLTCRHWSSRLALRQSGPKYFWILRVPRNLPKLKYSHLGIGRNGSWLLHRGFFFHYVYFETNGGCTCAGSSVTL